MLEQRRHHRQRVCLEGLVVAGLLGEAVRVRIRNLSPAGAEIVVEGSPFAEREVRFVSSRDDGDGRIARIVWRRFDRYGLAFDDGSLQEDDDPSIVPNWNDHSRTGGFDQTSN